MTAGPDDHGPRVSTSSEREVKLGAWPGFELPDLATALDGVVVVPAEVVELDATYHDAADLRLARQGITIRHRRGEGAARWTLKLPADRSGEGGVLNRRELEVPEPTGDQVPAELADLLTAHLREAALAPVARLRSHRRRLGVEAPDGTPLAEVDDDEVAVLDGEEVVARFREVEVELAPGAPEGVLGDIAEVLRAAGAGAPDAVPKLVRALGPRALAPPDVVVPDVGPEATVGELVAAALARSLARVVDHDHVVRLDDDPEGVHRARVGARQLRSHLRTFAPVLDPEVTAGVVGDLRWLGAELGSVRDADVLLARLRGAAEVLPALDGPATGAVLDRLRAERATHLDDLLVALRSPRYRALLERLVALVALPSLVVERGRPAAELAPGLVRPPWRKLRRAVAALDPEAPGDDDLHRVRILAKRARYACVAVAPVVGSPAADLGAALADLQDVLGDLHDAVVAEAWLRGAAEGATPAEAVAIGELVAVERREADRLRGAWREVWEAADRRRLRGWVAG